ncbi:MAG: diaminopimelate decarboxylase [Deltaproteobacteria bacterium]|nr:diaminopimelate decarboxylase [Deltaproteobacteria bacterium]
MDQFQVKAGRYFCEAVDLTQLAKTEGTPAYVYSRAMLRHHCESLRAAFQGYPTQACFAVKALSNLSVLKEIFGCGFGADLVSAGELERALLAGAPADKIVFSGVGKQAHEIERALNANIMMFNIESPFEVEMIATLAKTMGKVAAVSIRVNPNIDAQTNAKITTGLYSTKFGIAEHDLPALLDAIRRQPGLKLVALGCHIGSQILDLNPLRDAARQMAGLCQSVRQLGFELKHIDMGGGLGIRYRHEDPPSVQSYAATLIDEIKSTGLSLIIEPGRSLVGNIGILLTRVINVKKTPDRHFVVVDAAMNDLVRPTLYESYHTIEGVVTSPAHVSERSLCDIVGPICESGDYLGKDRLMTLPNPGDLLMVRGCGAYAASMASQYNSRPRAPELLVDGGAYKVARKRETLASLWADENDGLG